MITCIFIDKYRGGGGCIGIVLNLRLGSLGVRVVCGAFCLGGGSWVREL